MKKRIVILIASFILTVTASYARNKGSQVPERVIFEFYHDFSHPGNVKWEMVGDYYKASFNEHGKILFAFYTEDADLMGIASNMAADRLPASLLSEIKTKYSNYWISDLVGYSIKNTPGYLVTLENADQKIILKADGFQSWYLNSVTKKD